MKDRRFMSYKGHVIWYNEFGFMVAKGDGTDEYFSDWKDAIDYINNVLKGNN